MPAFYNNNQVMSGTLWIIRGDFTLLELRGCQVDGVECQVTSTNSRVNVQPGTFTGHSRFYRIMSAGSQFVILEVRKPGSPTVLETTRLDFQVTTPARPSFNLRLPVLETTAMQYGGLIGGPGDPLTAAEIALARPVFGDSIRYADVRVLTASVAAAPTTLGNTIRSTERSIPDHVLIHELAHIWQYQTGGGGYISSAGCAQVIAILSAGTRNAAYAYEPRGQFSTFNAEQQAHVIEDYFRMPNLQNDPWYLEVMRRVRAARPTSTTQSTYEESLYGRHNPNMWRTMDTNSPTYVNPTSTVPLVRVEF